MILDKEDKQDYIEIYSQRYLKYGYSPLTLGWNTGKQEMRFCILQNNVNLEGKRILDIGCGFGDLNKYLQALYSSYSYFGIDLVPELLKKARSIYCSNNNFKISFIEDDFLSYQFDYNFDYIFVSGLFGKKLIHNSNYNYVDAVLSKAMSLSTIGLGIDFSS